MDVEKLSKLVTEGRNPNTMNIDNVSTLEMIEMINEEDKKVPEAVGKAKESIAKAVDIIAERLSLGGRLIYVGAGTSGRIGILDASECPPTYGVSDDMVQGMIAGGQTAIFKAVEGAEDSKELGKKDLIQNNLTSKDVVCGIAASGRTPYVIGAMEYGKKVGAAVLCVTMNPESEMANIADVPIAVVVGPEVIMGSTRMKSGTAQKLILNMLTTGTMIKLGKVYENLMVNVQATNEKLVARARRIVKLATGAAYETIEKVLQATNNDVKLSIVIIKTGLQKEDAEELLKKVNGYVKKALDLM
ncbi:N-acetylmuramic acid 6-phosphate etherase [Clostridium coskatii]|uniref:N-acetylmuramic acid 6-phosphate etherase n=1 Tax=Clostridium coskatii TaxID=1705578 RepID=A0A166T383_9CLOT|nr:N-acetylmuramic acid 6-phosphate etherase [Clostridium coskatii]OAA93127.1 N-acetylmuramic acid 6-phosphate etherase [Clostridium coskatii]OBR90870.1 N-acetylmuramic acid 6-phosphate etherase [Clostridium coskatii]